MKICVKVYDFLPLEAKMIRTTVFVDEQHFIDEFDEDDNKAIHFVMFDDKTPVGTARVIFSNKHNCYTIGRFAIIKTYRGKHLGVKLLSEVENEIRKRFGLIEVGISSQERASGFYEKLGYRRTGEKYLDQYCPHVWMIKRISK